MTIIVDTCKSSDLHETPVVIIRNVPILDDMSSHSRGKGQPLGEFIAIAFEACGEEKAREVVQLAFDAHLVRFHDVNAVRSLIECLDSPTPSHESKTDHPFRQIHRPC